MASFIAPVATQTNPNAPLTSSLMKMVLDNPQAAFEGAPGAYRLAVGALQRLVAGATIKLSSAQVLTTGSTTAVELFSFAFGQQGTIRILFEHQTNGTGGAAFLYRRRDSVDTLISSFANTGSYVARSVDVAVAYGDALVVMATAGSGSLTNIRNVRLGTNGVDIFPGVHAPFVNVAFP